MRRAASILFSFLALLSLSPLLVACDDDRGRERGFTDRASESGDRGDRRGDRGDRAGRGDDRGDHGDHGAGRSLPPGLLEALDPNGDRLITEPELDAACQGLFNTLDSDGDGSVALDELTSSFRGKADDPR